MKLYTTSVNYFFPYGRADRERINIADAEVSFGQGRSLSFLGRRYQLTESLAWQRGNHSLRFGFDWEHATTSTQLITNEPAAIFLYSPQEVRQFNALTPPAARIPLPSSFSTLDDILRLPLRSFLTGIGPGLTPQRDFRKRRHLDLYRVYTADTWRINSRLNVNYGLPWSYEPNSLNTDLTKPKLLMAILGPDGLGPPVARKNNFSPSVGFAWAATRDAKTVIRGGAGRYFDPVSSNSTTLERERLALLPAGTGRRANISGTGIFFDGRALDFQLRPTAFTGTDLLIILPGIRAELLRVLNPDNRDFAFRNLDLDKAGANLSDPLYEAPYALHLSVSAYSRPPFSAFVSGVDFNGDGTRDDLLPGTSLNQFNRGFGKTDLARLVDSYNQEFAGKQTLGGQIAPRVMLPADYSFNDNFFTQDLRLSRAFPLRPERARLILFGEVFNLLNIANLVGYSGNIANPSEFSQAGARSSQVFGSGGPRAFQFGVRASF